MDNSFDEGESIDLASVVAEFPNGDDHPGDRIPVRKLSSVFDGLVKPEDSSMKVYLRIRPIKGKSEETISVDSDTTITTNAPEQSKRAQYTKTESRHYAFTRVFGTGASQETVYDQTTLPLFDRFLRGENCVLFAYGMTNAGKTYTIQGQNNNAGILPRLVTGILNAMSTSGSSAEHDSWDLHVSMLEIYQENIYDLLAKKKKEKLTIRDANGKVEVNHLSTHSIKTTKEACKLMDTAAYNRSKSSTFLNTGSSRSHAVYTVTLDRSNAEGVFDQSVAFQLVDLAGAERGNRTKATSAQQKEANTINKSLMQLWRCLQGMKKRNNADLSSSQEIIPFRESKLTHLLMPILNRAGMAGTAMIACVNPQSEDYDETLSILGNASLASKIKEITDVGRTTSSHISHSSTATNAAIAAAQKRRRAESSTSTGTTASHRSSSTTTSSSSTATTTTTTTHHGAAGLRKQNSSKNTTSTTTMGGNKRKLESASVDAADTEHQNGANGSDSDSSEVKRLRKEVMQLRDENGQLTAGQLARETEIRIEVSEEMAARSSHLLEQIQSLQNQLAEQTTAVAPDVTKSVKKERKRQMRTIAEDHAEKDIQEAEDEISRMKAMHEEELALLKSQNELLSSKFLALQQLHSQQQQLVNRHGEPSGIMPPSNGFSASKISKYASVFSTAPTTAAASSSSSSSAMQQSIDDSSAQVTAEFANRLQQQKPKKNDENSNSHYIVDVENAGAGVKKSPLMAGGGKGNLGKKSPLGGAASAAGAAAGGRSPGRSPLGDVTKNADNSPKLVAMMGGGGCKGYQSSTASHNAKRIDSPVRGGGRTLRSHMGRA
mmetsp:Transcript_6235/g.10364  ORF Transcript_6235/g.10364 Transcript_6235/m.10364 type:complete len:831 (+) Transcript_6235:49-2541(+)